MRGCLTLLGLFVAATAMSSCSPASEPIRVVGSSTVYPFAVRAAEQYSRETGQTVVIEQTGSGGGHKLFCAADSAVQATTSSRRRLPEERALCEANGRGGVMEVSLGYDSLILAQSTDAVPLALDLETVWRAVAARLPDAGCELVPNAAERWSDIDVALPDSPIELHGPPPTSGTRDAFVTLALRRGALADPCMSALSESDPDAFEQAISELRRDGRWVDAGENDNTLLQTLGSRTQAIGVMGRSSLTRAGDRVRIVPLNGMEAGEADALRRELYLYLDADAPPGLRAFAATFIGEAAFGPGGYLREAGLLPLPEAERDIMRKRLLAGTTP